ncbi:MAG: hypothetical protein ABJH28_05150 [Paraglaciecola sp.]|uniref:hypothetical protein n=1 Tax=Paraglaciecola sp. TaxID=1920173 RepID=UPI003265D750
MSRFFNDTPPPNGDFHYIPKGKANCRTSEIINIDGKTMRNPIGLSYSPVPITAPIISETILGIFETVPIPTLDGEDLRTMPLMGGAMAQPISMTTEQSSTVH